MKKVCDSADARSELSPFLLRILIVLCLILPGSNACYNVSSVGKAQCIRIGRYGASQWSTCVTDLYIRQKSKGRHGCVANKTRCIYQCMLEVHDSNSGEVEYPCSCSMNEPETTAENAPVLPSWCFSPNGGECNWYRSCLTRRYRCDKAFSEDVVAFAEQFCKLYLNPYSRFTQVGDLWLNGVRKCLLVSLVPLLRQWQQEKTWENSTSNAIMSFTNCYVSSFPGIPPICQVPLADLWTMFWHFRQSLPANSQQGLRAILRMIENCTEFRGKQLIRGKIRKLVLQFTKMASSSRPDAGFDKFISIDRIGDEIATEFLSDKTGIVWFSYPLTGTEEKREIAFFIADQQEYKLSQKSPNSNPAVSLNDTVSNLVKDAGRKAFRFRTFPGEQKYGLTGIVVCHNLECWKNNSWNVTVAASLSGSAHSYFQLSPVICIFYINLTLLYFVFLNI